MGGCLPDTLASPANRMQVIMARTRQPKQTVLGGGVFGRCGCDWLGVFLLEFMGVLGVFFLFSFFP